MKKILVSYGDRRFYESLKRIKRMGKKSNLFDKIILYTDEELPSIITNHPLFSSPKGGGYWIWKPYIINDALSKCDIGDIIYYMDSGCTLNSHSKEWVIFDSLLIDHNVILFQYRENYEYLGWNSVITSPDNNSARIYHWIKPLTEKYFSKKFGNSDYLNFGKIMGGFIIIKKTKEQSRLLSEWLNITINHPELIKDPEGEELKNLPKTFNCHRHDQSIITPLAYYYKDIDKIAILPETAESQKETAAVIASRFRQAKMPLWLNIKYTIYRLIKGDII